MPLAILCGSVALLAQPERAGRIERVENGLLPPVLIKGRPAWKLRERMEHYRVPGVSITVWSDYRIQWARAYGLKDVQTREPATETTLFQAGSISKPVAAMVALKKVEDGKFQLDEDINRRLASWKLPENAFTMKKKVTLAHLLSHTGGLTVHGFPGYAPGAKIPSLPEILDAAPGVNTAPVRVDIEPGTRFRYSGGGTTIAQLAVVDLEHKPYPEIARETVLDVLGMRHSSYEQPLPAEKQRQAASGHRPDGKCVEGKFHIYPEMAAAGLWTTPSDLAAFAIEIQLSRHGKSNRVLSRESVNRMLTPYIDQSACLGFFLEKRGEDFYFQHGGADEGFRAMLIAHRDKGWGAAVMVNSDNGQIVDEIIRAIAKEYGWSGYLPEPHEAVTLSHSLLERYPGRYLVNPTRVLTVKLNGDNLSVEATQAQPAALHPIAGDTFVREDATVRYRFGDGDKAESVEIIAGQESTSAVRIPLRRKVPYELLADGKTDEALQGYRAIRSQKQDSPVVSEARINNVGYELLRAGKTDAAIAVFKLNREFYPGSWNVYDSLGEAYMAKGDRARAIENYERSLALNPRNAGGKRRLEQLRK
jgi:CubicO group peptidase (beta-lactamase class C family)